MVSKGQSNRAGDRQEFGSEMRVQFPLAREDSYLLSKSRLCEIMRFTEEIDQTRQYAVVIAKEEGHIPKKLNSWKKV